MAEVRHSFELTRFPAAELAALPVEVDDAVREALTEGGVPGTWVEGRLADEHLSVVVAEDGEPLIRFGSERRGFPAAYYVHPKTGAVSIGRLPDHAPVNASLAAFTETVRQATLLYPFYTPGPPSSFDACREAADRLAAVIETVEPGAMEPGRFWIEFWSDVSHGDWATADEQRRWRHAAERETTLTFVLEQPDLHEAALDAFVTELNRDHALTNGGVVSLRRGQYWFSDDKAAGLFALAPPGDPAYDRRQETALRLLFREFRRFSSRNGPLRVSVNNQEIGRIVSEAVGPPELEDAIVSTWRSTGD